jgi:hypothetical protein
MAFAAVIDAREDARNRLGKLREAMRLRREREKATAREAAANVKEAEGLTKGQASRKAGGAR